MLMHFKEEQPRQLIQRTFTRFITVAKRAQIKLFADVPDDLPGISVDRATFSRLLGNLISNAVKFTPEEGEIEISAELVMDPSKIKERIPSTYEVEKLPLGMPMLQIMVRDTGAGIPEESLEGIFDRFRPGQEP